MQFLVISRRKTEAFSEAEIAPMVEHEVQAARAFYQEGFIRQIWHRGDEPGGILLVEAESLEAAQKRLSTLPMKQAGMLETVMLIPLNPYRGFAPR